MKKDLNINLWLFNREISQHSKMKPIKAKARGLTIGSFVPTCDNSGAKFVRIVAVIRRGKTVKGRNPSCGVSDHIKVSVRRGDATIKGKVFDAVVVRQAKEFRRLTGERVKFEDNAVVLLKDNKGNPKGTLIKGPVAREVAERWPNVSKLAPMIV